MKISNLVIGAMAILSLRLSGQPLHLPPMNRSQLPVFSVAAIDARGSCRVPHVLDHTCIANAIAALPSSGGTVFLGDGNYTLDASVSIVDRVHVTLYGYGATLTAVNGLNSDLLLFDNCQWCRVIGLNVNGNGTSQKGASSGVVFRDSAYSTIEDVSVTGCLTAGIYLYYDGAGTSADEITVATSYIQNNLGIGILVQAVNDSILSGSHVDHNGGTAGIQIEGGFNNVAVQNNVLSNIGHGIFVYGGKRNDVRSNQVRNNGQDGIVYQMTAESIIDGNTTHINSQGAAGTYSGIVCYDCANITVSSNVSVDTDFPPMHQAYGIQVLGASTNITVSGNILVPNLDGAASLAAGSVVSASGNIGLADTDRD
jgi:parallel beta-helix repeat protein